jgi:uncharacterized delta-60 repeat protein
MSIKTGTYPSNLLSFKSLTLALVLVVNSGLAQAQRLMDDFKPVIKGYPNIYSMEVDEVGRVYLGGIFTMIGDQQASIMVRINADGSLDESFTNTTLTDYYTTDIVVSSDSLILFVNDQTLVVSKKDGTPETSFNLDEAILTVFAVAIADEKFIVAGRLRTPPGNATVLRLNRDGTIDETFESNTIELTTYNTNIKVLNDGKILVAGNVTAFNGMDVGGVVKLNQDGSKDETFFGGSGSNGFVADAEVLNSGKILLTGNFDQFNEVATPGGLVRLNADGTIDGSFTLGPAGDEFAYKAAEVEILEDGKLLIGGDTRNESYQNFKKLIRLNSDGSIDNTFSPVLIDRGNFSPGFIVKKGLQGEIFTAGEINGSDGQIRIGLIKFNESGELLDYDLKIGREPGFAGVARQTDGKVILAGSFYQINGIDAYGLARINQDGTLDESFAPNLGLSNPNRSWVDEVEVQSDGKILVAGLFYDVIANTSGQHQIVRLLPNGEVDLSFGEVVFDRTINELTVDAEDNIFVVGSFSTANGLERSGLAKFSEDGQIISEFNSNDIVPQNSNAASLIILGDDEILVGGRRSNNYGFIYKLDRDGNLISSLLSDSFAAATISTINKVGDKLVFGGSINTGGGRDTTMPLFISDLEANNIDDSSIRISEENFNLQFFQTYNIDNNEIIVAGSFTRFNGEERSGLVRCNLSGEINPDFNFNVSGLKKVLGRVQHFIPEDNQTALIFGPFSELNGIPFFGAARIKFLNSIPEISGIVDEIATEEDIQITLSLDNFQVTDEDDLYPEELMLIIGGAENYTVDGNVVTPDQNYFGTLTVPVKISDGKDESETYELSIQVTPVNDMPVIAGLSEPINIDENTSIELSLDNFTVTDPDNTFPDDFTLTLWAGTNYTLDGLTVIPNNNFNGKLIVKATVTDSEVSSDVFEAEITVVSTNEAPVISAFGGTLSTPEEAALVIELSDFSVSDPDNTFPENFTLSIESGDNYTVAGATITPATDFNGTLTVPVKVNDSEADSPVFELSVEVTPVNDVPVILSYVGILTGSEDSPLAFSLDGFSITDPDNTFPTDFSFTLEAGDNYTVDGASILPAANYFGSLSVSATVSDGATSSAPYIIAVTINPVNDNPIITGYSGATTTLEETGLTIDLASLSVTDPDNSFPSDFTLDIFESTTYTISGAQITPINDFNGTMTVPVRVSTIDNNSEHFNLTIEVTPVNDAPVIDGYTGELEMDEATSLEFNINSFLVTDPDNTFPEEHSVLVSEGDNYSVNGSSITPTTDFTGELSVPVLVSDGTAASAPNILTITVNEVTGISSLARSVTVFPIPIESELTLKMDNSFVGDFSIRVIDLTGNVVLERKIRKNTRSSESVIDLRHLGVGTFVFHVELPVLEVISRRIIIE